MFLKNMTHALVMVCLVLELLAMEYSIQERKQMILRGQLLRPMKLKIIGFGQEVCLKKEI